ncbi:hypothetical protein K469DRAFT_366584 [Zopfia rhizophila CBS 207.26]|uniref:Acid phosphatase-like protein n=1 Tax=Zopfia rhizophila CBS 207.26 TaxID=1314779 RepID=A0A6A6EM87_9PEZI|nr:hypothetical protein K469DRAFT_366584 [Zopfia rhizophila CBS 207.26]
MKGWAIFIIILLLAIIGGYGGWVLWSRMRAKRLGLPPPSLNPFASSPSPNYPAPAPGGIRGWIDTQVRKLKNRNNRSAAGAYEEPSTHGGPRGRGAGHRLDPDEAWDARVGNEAYYEEQELGLHAPQGNTSYGDGYGAPSPSFQPPEPERGRSRTREYDDSLHSDARSAQNPFGDDNAASLRGVSPRPLDHGQDTSYEGAQAKKVATGGSDESPTERRSMFRENM